MRLFVATIMMMAALSGCLDDSETDEADPAVGPDAQPLTTWLESEIHREFVTTGVAAVYVAMDEADYITIKGNATKLVVNASVSLDTPGSVEIRLREPGCDLLQGTCNDHFIETDDEDQLVIEDPTAGEWSVVVFARPAVASGSMDLHISQLLEDEMVDEDEHDPAL